MRYIFLLEPLSPDDPCGPDLDETGDIEYANYMQSFEDRLPSPYYELETGAAFDRARIKLGAEVAVTSALLKRSRDLAVLTVEARFQAIAGQISGFRDCLATIAGLLERYWHAVHPRALKGHFAIRRNVVEELNGLSSSVFPLQNAPIVNDRRFGDITLRQHRVSRGELAPLPQGKVLTPADIAKALTGADLKDPAPALEAGAAVHASLKDALNALDRIEQAFVVNGAASSKPGFAPLRETLQQMARLIEHHRPDLAPATRAAEPGEVDQTSRSVNGAGTGTPVASQAEAQAALLAAEHYFARSEASSPSLILIAQARHLIGKPFVVALAELLPDMAAQAVIKIDPKSGFQMGMARMLAVTEGLANPAGGAAIGDKAAPFRASTRAEAVDLMAGVETFLREVEPSSPVPLLLEKARGFVRQDFNAILRAVLPASSS